MSKLMIVVDMQKDFIDGSLGTKEAVSIVPNVKKLIAEKGVDYLWFTRDTHPENYMDTREGKHLPVPHCIRETDGWQIPADIYEPGVKGARSSQVIDKPTFGSIDLVEKLKTLDADDIDEIIFCGLCTDICVVSNVLIVKALFPEKEITVYADCCAGVTPAKHEAALDTMESCQINFIGRGNEPWKK